MSQCDPPSFFFGIFVTKKNQHFVGTCSENFVANEVIEENEEKNQQYKSACVQKESKLNFDLELCLEKCLTKFKTGND